MGVPSASIKSIPTKLGKSEQGTLSESFGTRTATPIAPVGSLYFQDEDYIINNFSMGSLSKNISPYLLEIQYGSIKDPYCWIVSVI